MASEARILLIDDDPDMHVSVRLILERAGYRVACCSSGSSGMLALQRDRPDLVLMDVMLAHPSEGFHLVYQMKADERLRDIPVIVITAVGKRYGIGFTEEVGSEFMPVDGFVEKPFDADTLVQAVRSAFERRAHEPT